MNLGKLSTLGELFLLFHNGLGQACDKTHEHEAKLDNPVKKCRKGQQDFRRIVEQGLDRLGLFDNLCLSGRHSRHSKGMIVIKLVRTVGIQSGLKGVDRSAGR